MRLESVSLHGFKSFAEKSVLKVTPGITAIVGPNGCGKSNIWESVRWALGEQSAKSLRGQRMEDLIFHGSASRKPVGFAEVELIFSNDGVLSVPWTEVAVSRRLYRTGESEYLLNKNPSRLRDILDLFAGTGANPRAYSVMDQDKLNHVLTAKPHERRVFIEEAAGIARYKQQRNETQGKLDATKQNLVRARDVMDEVKRQLSSLERQAKKAQQYKALQTTKRDLSLVVLAAEYMARVAEGERRGGELSRPRGPAEVRPAPRPQLAAAGGGQPGVLPKERTRPGATRLGRVRVAAGRVDLRRRGGGLGERAAQLRRRAERLAAELSDATAEAAGIDALRASLVQARDVTQTELGALAGERAELATRLAAEERRLAEAEGALANARVTLAAHRSSLDALAALERAREGYGAGVRAVFDQEHAEALTGVVGTVADLLEVPLGMERAIEAVPGERPQGGVGGRGEHARA